MGDGDFELDRGESPSGLAAPVVVVCSTQVTIAQGAAGRVAQRR